MLKKSPNLAHFLWWRVVADEAHEILTLEEAKQTRKQQKANIAASLITQQEIRAPTTQSPGLKELSRLKSRYRWYVTGTPFPHAEKSLAAAMKVCLGKNYTIHTNVALSSFPACFCFSSSRLRWTNRHS